MTDYLQRNSWIPFGEWFAHPVRPIMVARCNGGWIAVDECGRERMGATEREAYTALRDGGE